MSDSIDPALQSCAEYVALAAAAVDVEPRITVERRLLGVHRYLEQWVNPADMTAAERAYVRTAVLTPLTNLLESTHLGTSLTAVECERAVEAYARGEAVEV